jgi:hypothetical protein
VLNVITPELDVLQKNATKFGKTNTANIQLGAETNNVGKVT